MTMKKQQLNNLFLMLSLVFGGMILVILTMVLTFYLMEKSQGYFLLLSLFALSLTGFVFSYEPKRGNKKS